MNLATSTRESGTGAALRAVSIDLLRLWLLAKHVCWSSAGAGFGSAHAMFDEFASSYLEAAERVGERLRALEVSPAGRPQATGGAPDPIEVPADDVDATEAVRRFLLPLDAVAQRVRALLLGTDDDDVVTHDLLASVLGTLEHQRWMLRGHR